MIYSLLCPLHICIMLTDSGWVLLLLLVIAFFSSSWYGIFQQGFYSGSLPWFDHIFKKNEEGILVIHFASQQVFSLDLLFLWFSATRSSLNCTASSWDPHWDWTLKFYLPVKEELGKRKMWKYNFHQSQHDQRNQILDHLAWWACVMPLDQVFLFCIVDNFEYEIYR